MLALVLEPDMDGVGRAWRTGRDCSLDGGTGTGSDCSDTLSPNGPKGPSESSTASSRVGCASTRRGVLGVRGPLPAGDLGAEAADRAVGGAGLSLVDSVNI